MIPLTIEPPASPDEPFPGSVSWSKVEWLEDGTGRIVASGSSSLSSMLLKLQRGAYYIGGRFSDAEYYVQRGEGAAGSVRKRPFICRKTEREIAADGVAKVRLGSVPAGTIVRFDREEHQVDDGVFEFVTAKPGTYLFELVPPHPYRSQTLTVTAK